MEPSLVRVVSVSNGKCLYKKKKRCREGHVKMQAEIVLMEPQAKE